MNEGSGSLIKLENIFMGGRFSYFLVEDDGSFSRTKASSPIKCSGYAYAHPSIAFSRTPYALFVWKERLWFAAKDHCYDVTSPAATAVVKRDGFFGYVFSILFDGRPVFQLSFRDTLLPRLDSSGESFFIDMAAILEDQEVKLSFMKNWEMKKF